MLPRASSRSSRVEPNPIVFVQAKFGENGNPVLANILGPARAIYRWQGRIEEAEEVAAIFKTTVSQAPFLIARLNELHLERLAGAPAQHLGGADGAQMATVGGDDPDPAGHRRVGLHPLPVSHVSQSDMSASVYTISTVEGTVIEPVTWLNNGGSVRVEVSDDTKMLIVTITGANDPSLAPFRIGISSGNNEFYSSLRIRGEGVFWSKELMTLYLHEDTDLAPDEVGFEVDVPFMESADQLYHRLLLTAWRSRPVLRFPVRASLSVSEMAMPTDPPRPPPGTRGIVHRAGTHRGFPQPRAA